MSEEKIEQKNAEQEIKELYEKNREYVLELVAAGKLPEPRKLNRSERRRMDAAKVNIFKTEPDDPRTYHAIKEDMADWIIDNIYPEFDFGNVENNVASFFGEYIFGLSYKNDITAKN
ncbi:MAG: hypothetical protein ACRDBM_08725 [Sporomusa sp.]